MSRVEGFLRDNRWALPAILCVALLVLPAVAWIAAPHAGGFTPPPMRRHTTVTRPIADDDESAEDSDDNQAPSARPTSEPASDVAPEGEISGTVVDPTGKPVSRAVVHCTDKPNDTTLTARSDGEGHYVLRAAAEGCKAIALHEEYAPSNDDHVYKNRPNELRLKAGGSIEGRVVDERGAGIGAYKLAVESYVGAGVMADFPRPLHAAQHVSDLRGAFTLEKLAPGRYILTASTEGRPPAHSDAIDVDSGHAIRNIKITLAKGAKLTGKIIDAQTKRPLAGATVSLDELTDSQANAISPATTDQHGIFSLEGAPPGPFSLRVAHPGHHTKIVAGLTSTANGPNAVDVELTPSGDGGDNTEMTGIGVQIMPANGLVRVGFVQPDGPALQAGVEEHDLITRIDGVDVRTLTLGDCMQRLRGPAGSRVVVNIDRGDTQVELTITRGEIHVGPR